MYKKKLTLRILFFLIFTDVLETFTQFCFKKGALMGTGIEVATFTQLLVFLKVVFSSAFVWLGILSVIATFIMWSTILSKIDLSVAVPIASSSYILVPIISIIFFHEKVVPLRWAGILFIIIGVIFVSLSTKEARQESG